MSQKVKAVEAYLARLSSENRHALQQLRTAIRAAVPKAEECICYGIPAFRLNGRFLVGLGAGAKHCSFYPGAVVKTLGVELMGYDTSKGTIRFPPRQAFAQDARPEAGESPNRKTRHRQEALTEHAFAQKLLRRPF
jgi:uncharacterized protein YdhG (YjbR/CyaY superfamily)